MGSAFVASPGCLCTESGWLLEHIRRISATVVQLLGWQSVAKLFKNRRQNCNSSFLHRGQCKHRASLWRCMFSRWQSILGDRACCDYVSTFCKRVVGCLADCASHESCSSSQCLLQVGCSLMDSGYARPARTPCSSLSAATWRLAPRETKKVQFSTFVCKYMQSGFCRIPHLDVRLPKSHAWR